MTVFRPLLTITTKDKNPCFALKPLPDKRWSRKFLDLNPYLDSHPAIMLVSAYIVERGLILEPYEVDSKTNEITAIPAFIEQMAVKGVVFCL
ncbi:MULTISPECIES: hypothetical protein [unclassified Microcoleus]|uniref:hypothetical protein n=1 Tax=unclassified Microcoleus TaxID=2642155 RepID=UPI002FD47726